MRLSFFYFFTIVLWGNYVQAQLINFTNNSAFVIFSSDDSAVNLDFGSNVIVNNTQNVALQGKIYSDESIAVIPQQNYSIVFRPQIANPPCPTCSPGDPPGTVIKPKPGGSGKIYAPITVVYPIPVHTDLTFDVSNYFVQDYAIYDMYGIVKVSQPFSPPAHTATIDVSGFTNGNYILKLNLGSNIYSSIQFIKN